MRTSRSFATYLGKTCLQVVITADPARPNKAKQNVLHQRLQLLHASLQFLGLYTQDISASDLNTLLSVQVKWQHQ